MGNYSKKMPPQKIAQALSQSMPGQRPAASMQARPMPVQRPATNLQARPMMASQTQAPANAARPQLMLINNRAPLPTGYVPAMQSSGDYYGMQGASPAKQPFDSLGGTFGGVFPNKLVQQQGKGAMPVGGPTTSYVGKTPPKSFGG